MNLVGRDRELATLGELLDRAARGAGGALAVQGAPGAGKSALADAVAAAAGRRGFEVLRVAVGAAGAGRLPWAQLLRDAGGPSRDAQRLLAPSGPLDLVEAVRGLVSTAPRLIVVDDLDRAGPEAVEVLALLASRLAGSATVVLVTWGRPVEGGPTLHLGPLSEADLGTLTEERRPDVRREARRARLDRAIAVTAGDPAWSPVVARLGCLRGIDTLTAFALAVEIGDWQRFTGASIGAYLGLVPSESSSGSSRSQGPITKTGNTHARRLLVEAAWHHRPRYRAGSTLVRRWDQAPPAARARGHEGNQRLHQRWLVFTERHKRPVVANVAIARELAGWCWSLAVLPD